MRGEDGFWLSAVTGMLEHFATDTQFVNGLKNPFFPYWIDDRHLVFNHDGIHVITLR